jgi:hypothetical protein
MSKIAISGASTGSATFTIESPATSTNRTLTLPDNTGTIITQNSTPAFASTIGVGGATAAASGAGITFPATQSASSDANTLDDYEEGTAAVTLSPETSGTITVNTTQDSIAYTKVGRQVTIIGQVQITSVSNPVGAFVHINSLPFVSADLSELSGRVGGAVTFFDDNINTYTAKGVLMLEGGTQMRMYVDASTVAANDGFVFSFSYFTT